MYSSISCHVLQHILSCTGVCVPPCFSLPCHVHVFLYVSAYHVMYMCCSMFQSTMSCTCVPVCFSLPCHVHVFLYVSVYHVTYMCSCMFQSTMSCTCVPVCFSLPYHVHVLLHVSAYHVMYMCSCMFQSTMSCTCVPVCFSLPCHVHVFLYVSAYHVMYMCCSMFQPTMSCTCVPVCFSLPCHVHVFLYVSVYHVMYMCSCMFQSTMSCTCVPVCFSLPCGVHLLCGQGPPWLLLPGSHHFQMRSAHLTGHGYASHNSTFPVTTTTVAMVSVNTAAIAVMTSFWWVIKPHRNISLLTRNCSNVWPQNMCSLHDRVAAICRLLCVQLCVSGFELNKCSHPTKW